MFEHGTQVEYVEGDFMRLEWERTVKQSYPEAKILHERTYGRSDNYTCMDPISGMNLGPTAFSEDAAWKYACERLCR